MGRSSLDVPLTTEIAPETTDSKPRMRLTEALLVIAPLPLFTAHLAGLWARDSYRFFPLLLVAIGGLVFRRAALYGIVPDEQRTRSSRFVIVVGLMFTVASVLLASPWLAASAMVLMIGGVSSRVAGETFRKHLLPIWCLLWLLLPPPFGFDRLIVQRYDEGVRHIAETILDCAGSVQWLAGDILQMSDRQFVLPFGFARFVTPYAAMAFAAVVAMWHWRSSLQAVALMVSAVWWLFVSEVACIVAVPVFYRCFGIDLTSPWLSIAASGLVVAVAVLLIQSTDILLQPLVVTAAALNSAAVQSGMAVAEWLRQARMRTPSAEAEQDVEGSAAPQAELVVIRHRVSPPIVARTVCVVCAALACAQIALFFKPLMASAGRTTLAQGNADVGRLLPREIGVWQRKTSASKGGSQAVLGQERWQFVSGDSTIEVSISALSGEIRDVTADYLCEGWNVYRRVDWMMRSLRREVRVPQTEIDMVNSAGDAAWVVSGAVDSRGVPRGELSAAIRGWLLESPGALVLRGLGAGPSAAVPPLGLRFFVKSDEPLSPQQREAVRDAFRELVETIWQQRNRV